MPSAPSVAGRLALAVVGGAVAGGPACRASAAGGSCRAGRVGHPLGESSFGFGSWPGPVVGMLGGLGGLGELADGLGEQRIAVGLDWTFDCLEATLACSVDVVVGQIELPGEHAAVVSTSDVEG